MNLDTDMTYKNNLVKITLLSQDDLIDTRLFMSLMMKLLANVFGVPRN